MLSKSLFIKGCNLLVKIIFKIYIFYFWYFEKVG